MTVCRTSQVLALMLALTSGAAAQDQPATQSPPVATGAPTPLGGTAPPSDASPPDNAPVEFKPGTLGKSDRPGITTGELGIVDGPPVGLLDDEKGGLGQSMWTNASRAELEDLLGRIPLVSADPFVRALSRRVVLTTSDAPVGPAKRALATIRIEKLMQAGLFNEAGALAASLRLDNDPDFGRVQSDALLYSGRDKDVCNLTATRLTSSEPYWLELRTWCFAATGDAASADLTRSVMEAQGIKDAAFDLLSNDVLTGKKTLPKDAEHPTALHVYLLGKAGLPVPGPVAAKLGTIANLLAARDARNTPADRLAAAARISATGALSPAEMIAILNAQKIADDQLASAIATTAKLTFLPSQSLLRRAATVESRPPEKTELLLAALSAGGHIDRLPLTSALQLDLVLPIRPDAATIKGRFLISRALLLQGKLDAAAAWYEDGADETDLHVFQILADLASPTPARDSVAQTAYTWFAKHAAPQQDPAPISALALGFSDVLGRSMPPDARALAGTLEGMRWAGTRPADDDMRKLVEAASQPGRKGEAILRVLDFVGGDGPAGLPPDVAIECVRVLQQMGLMAEARALAVETLALTHTPAPAP